MLPEAAVDAGLPGPRAAIMQPYFFPYVGYFQLIAAADSFVVYDNIEYTKSGWINRNRILRDGGAALLSLPLKRAPDHSNVCERELAAEFDPRKLLNQISGAYRRAPHFQRVFSLLELILLFDDRNLFRFLHNSIRRLCEYLGIGTAIVTSSAVGIDHALRKQDKVLALCEALGATRYVNPVGGVELYSRADFDRRGIELKFLRARLTPYPQFGGDFVPGLSIVDVMMFNSPEGVRAQVAHDYELS